MEWIIKDRTYLQGDFRGKYRGKLNEHAQNASLFKDYDITVYEATIERAERTDQEITDEAPDRKGYVLRFLPEVNVEHTDAMSGSKTIYQVSVLKAYVQDLHITDVHQEGNSTFGTITGKVIALIDEKREEVIPPHPDPEAIPEKETEPSGDPPGTDPAPDHTADKTNTFSWSDLIGLVFALPIVVFWIAILASLFQLFTELGPWAWYLAMTAIGMAAINFLFPGIRRWIFSLLNGIARKFSQSDWFSVFIFWASLLFIIWLFNNSYYPLGFTFGALDLLLLLLILFPTYPAVRNILAGLSFIFLLFAIPQFIPTPHFVRNGSVNSILAEPDWVNAPRPNMVPRPVRERSTEEMIAVADPASIADSQYIYHQLNWLDYELTPYVADLKVFTADYLSARQFREQLANETKGGAHFSYFFDQIVGFDQDKLTELEDLLDSLQRVHQFDRTTFAEVIVSLVQSIPYVLLFPDTCTTSPTAPCLGDVTLGVHTPIEFLYTLAGDCDTRVLLLFAIFHRFGYEVIVLGSTHYQHALLGIKLPVEGTAIDYLGERFLIWETTSFGWLPGEIPPNCRELKYWEVLLSNYQPI